LFELLAEPEQDIVVRHGEVVVTDVERLRECAAD